MSPLSTARSYPRYYTRMMECVASAMTGEARRATAAAVSAETIHSKCHRHLPHGAIPLASEPAAICR